MLKLPNTNFRATFRLAKPRLPVFVAEENWFGQAKYGAKIHIYPTLYRLLLKKISFCVFDFVYLLSFWRANAFILSLRCFTCVRKNQLRSWKNEENLKNCTFSIVIDSYNLQMAIFYFTNSYFPFHDSQFPIPNSYFSTGINQSGDKNGHVSHLIGWNKNSAFRPDIPCSLTWHLK